MSNNGIHLCYDPTFRKLTTQSITLLTDHLARLLEMKKINSQLLHDMLVKKFGVQRNHYTTKWYRNNIKEDSHLTYNFFMLPTDRQQL